MSGKESQMMVQLVMLMCLSHPALDVCKGERGKKEVKGMMRVSILIRVWHALRL